MDTVKLGKNMGNVLAKTSTTSKVDLFVIIVSKFLPLTNIKKNCYFICSGDSRYPTVGTVKLGENMDNVLAKILKKSIFSKMKYALPLHCYQRFALYFKI